MKKIVSVKNKEAVISSIVMSEGFGLKIAPFHQLISKHSESLECFGEINKVIGLAGNTTNTPRGGKNKVTYWLNENQAIFIMTYTRKTEQTNQFRIDLIKAFSKLKNEANHVQSLLLEAQRLMRDYKVRGKDWSDFGRELNKRKPLIACALEDAEKLSQLELGFE